MTHVDTHGPGRPRAGMREVAQRAGVAMSSVSRVLSGHPDVSPKMREAVLAAVAELGYRPDMLAQGLRSRKTLSVGFTVSDIANPVLAGIVTGAEKRLRLAGYSLLLTNSEGDADLDAEHIRLLEQRRVDGLLLSLAEEHHPATVRALRELDIPTTLVDRDIPEGIRARSAIFDHRAGMAAAAQHLLELGHRDVALIIGGPQLPARERRRGVEETFQESGTGARCHVFQGEFSGEYGAGATAMILRRESRPTAIIAGGNMLMQGALRQLHAEGVRVGTDISFIGCDDVAFAELHEPPIAVVDRDVNAMGVAAAELLLAQMAGETDLEDVVLPTRFVPRASCARVG
ncbi:MAG: LacI family DNA-binding transcriptional regulator [Gaiellaceae bacterium]